MPNGFEQIASLAADRPYQVASQAWLLTEIRIGDDLEERCGVANPFAVNEEFTSEELA